jgi:hypothetical protein
MKSILFAAGVLLVGTAAQAEIMCTTHRGCFETGGRIFRSGGVGIQPIVNHRDGDKNRGKQVRIRRQYFGNE